MSRSFGGMSLTSRSPMKTLPSLSVSSPATMLRRVDLPQPDGPTRTMNSPSSMSRLTPFSTSVDPKRFHTFSRRTPDMAIP